MIATYFELTFISGGTRYRASCCCKERRDQQRYIFAELEGENRPRQQVNYRVLEGEHLQLEYVSDSGEYQRVTQQLEKKLRGFLKKCRRHTNTGPCHLITIRKR